jgi:transposase
LFYYFRLEDQVSETHLLRLIEKHISFVFVREKLKESYSEMGDPSIDPELLLRILLIGYLYGISSERKQSRNIDRDENALERMQRLRRGEKVPPPTARMS